MIKIKKILSLSIVWIIFLLLWYLSYKYDNGLYGFFMVIITISGLPFIIMGAIIDHFNKLKQ